MAGNTNPLTLLAIAGIGAATGGLALPALAAAGGATAAAGAGAAAAGGFSMTGALLGASTLFQAYSSVQAGNAAASAAKTQQAQQRLQMASDQAQAAIEEEQRQKRLRSMLSTQRAIFGAANITGEGMGDRIAALTVGATNRNTDLASTSANINNAQSLSSILQSGRDASASQTGGYVKAGGTLLQFAGQQYDRSRT